MGQRNQVTPANLMFIDWLFQCSLFIEIWTDPFDGLDHPKYEICRHRRQLTFHEFVKIPDSIDAELSSDPISSYLTKHLQLDVWLLAGAESALDFFDFVFLQQKNKPK
jgi:hypothetical protein